METELLSRLAALVFPAFLGFLAGRLGLFKQPDDALRVLNTFALHFGFPALIALGVTKADLSQPLGAVFWLIWPIALLGTLLALRLWKHPQIATMGLVVCFGNVAYLGLPFLMAVYGEDASGPAALAVSLHVVLAVTVGPAVAIRWSGGQVASLGATLRKVATMPLVWAPLVGVLMRLLPDDALSGAQSLLAPLAGSAAPVALFMLGLFLHHKRALLARPDAGVFFHVAARQLVAPGLALAVAFGAVALGMAPELARVQVVLAAMPAAVTTFSIALENGTGADRVGAAIVWSSALSVVLLPAWTWLVGVVF